jgi:hypothetical protein
LTQDRCTVCVESSVHLEIVLILMQDRCMVCVEHAIGLEIDFDASNELLGDVGHVKSLFLPFGDSFNVVQDRCMVSARVP